MKSMAKKMKRMIMLVMKRYKIEQNTIFVWISLYRISLLRKNGGEGEKEQLQKHVEEERL